MKGVKYIIALLCIIIVLTKPTMGYSFNPYSLLRLNEGATNSQIQKQYKKLRSKNRSSRAKKSMIRKAYKQIMFERQFNTKQDSSIPLVKTKPTYFPEHIDQTYLYGYKLGNEFDDGTYFRQNFNETRFIIERQLKSDTNKKTASLILFIGSIFFKMIPCFIIFCLCRSSEGLLSNALGRARAGYVNIGRRREDRI